jgi:predicted secreted protein
MVRKGLLLGVLIVLVGWTSLAPEVSGTEMVRLTRTDSGRNFTVGVGALIRIELEEQGGTGYLWLLDALDQRFFELVRVESLAGNGPGVLGGPIIKIWELKAKQKGKAELNFSYCRPWEGKEAAQDRFMAGITIE